MDQELKVVLAGCGGMSNRWVQVAKEIEGLEIVGLVDLNLEAAKARRDRHELGDVPLGTDLAEMLDRTRPDILFDCTVPEAHCEVTLTGLAHGCHVMGEKPLADSMENARKMVAAAQEAGKLYAVIQNRRYDPHIRRIAKFLASGALGKVTTVNSDFYLGAHFGGFRVQMEHVLLLDMAIHTFDQARVLTGADPIGVYCKEWNPSGSWYAHDASAMAIFDMTEGIVYNYRGSWCSEGLNTSWECDWRIVCERGTVLWDGGEGISAEVVKDTGDFKSELTPIEVPPADPDEKRGGHEGLLREFVHCVRTGETPETVCSDNIKSLSMVFGAIESAQTSARVNLA